MATRFDVITVMQFVLVLLSGLVGGCASMVAAMPPPSYSAPSIEATVVDAATGEPLEGVIVVVSWDLESTVASPSPRGYLHVAEAVTDAHGAFRVPAWGPLQAPTLSGDRARLPPFNPVLVLYRSGYTLRVEDNGWDSAYLADPWWTGDPIRGSRWNGKKLELKRFVGTPEQYNDDVGLARAGLPAVPCFWKVYPKMTRALFREGERLKHIRGYNAIMQMSEIQERYGPVECGSSKTFQGELMK